MQRATSLVLVLVLVVLFQLSCSNSTTDTPQPTPAPEEDMVTPVAGVYKLSNVTASGGNPTIIGVGSLTITAIDKTTAAITQARSFTNTTTGSTTSINSIKDEVNKIEKSGTNYLIKATNGRQWATISNRKLTTDDVMALTPATSLTLNTEYTR